MIASIENPQELVSRTARMRWARKRIRPRISQKELAHRIGVSLKAVQLMESESGTQRSKYLDRVASELGISLRWLMDGLGEPYTQNEREQCHYLPAVASDGELDKSDVGVLGFSWLKESSKDLVQFCLQDDSMAPLLPLNTRVVINPQADIEPGSYVLIKEDKQPPVLRVWRDRGFSVELAPLNADFASVIVAKTKVRVLGGVVGYWVPM